MKIIINILVIICLSMVHAYGQSKSEKINKSYTINEARNIVLVLANINGGIKVEKGTSDEIIILVEKTVNAKSEALLTEGWESVRLLFEEKGDSILAYLKTPCHIFNGFRKKDKRWGYNSDHMDDCEEDFDYRMDFTVKVPENINLHISTINEGEIDISGIKGNIAAYHINGGITINGAKGPVDLYTINGDVNISYQNLPESPSSYYTLNGDINALFPQGLEADMSFKSFNGDFYTNINDVTQEPQVKKIPAEKNDMAFKIAVQSTIKARDGGVELSFETFNGDVFVKENLK